MPVVTRSQSHKIKNHFKTHNKTATKTKTKNICHCNDYDDPPTIISTYLAKLAAKDALDFELTVKKGFARINAMDHSNQKGNISHLQEIISLFKYINYNNKFILDKRFSSLATDIYNTAYYYHNQSCHRAFWNNLDKNLINKFNSEMYATIITTFLNCSHAELSE